MIATELVYALLIFIAIGSLDAQPPPPALPPPASLPPPAPLPPTGPPPPPEKKSVIFKVQNKAAYAVKIFLKCKLNNEDHEDSSGDCPVAQCESMLIPPDCTDTKVMIKMFRFIRSKKTIYEVSNPTNSMCAICTGNLFDHDCKPEDANNKCDCK